jgi:uncharacterized integral membrane protein
MRLVNVILWIGLVIGFSGLSIENSAPVTLKVIQNVEVEIPLFVALLGAMGLGALLVLASTVWSEIRQFRVNRQTVDQQSQKIRDLEQTIAQFPDTANL